VVPAHQIDKVLGILKPFVDAIGATVGSHCEVILHDLRVPESSIVAISNGSVTGRHVGGPVVGGPMKDMALSLLDSAVRESTLSIGYKTETRDGRELRSTSLVLRTPEGKPAIALCINIDLSVLTMARAFLEELSKTVPANQDVTPGNNVQTEVGEVVAQIIREAIDGVGKPPKYMNRDERLRAVRLMHERGLFLIRGGLERAATALNISRFTLYSDLREVRELSRQ
jgi:predicted transcriptional regulator YheO